MKTTILLALVFLSLNTFAQAKRHKSTQSTTKAVSTPEKQVVKSEPRSLIEINENKLCHGGGTQAEVGLNYIAWAEERGRSYKYCMQVFDELGYEYYNITVLNGQTMVTYRKKEKGIVVEVTYTQFEVQISMVYYAENVRGNIGVLYW